MSSLLEETFLDASPVASPPFGERGVKVEVFQPEQPFGGVQVEGVADIPIQIEINTGSPVFSVFGRTGNIAAKGEDYAAFYAPIGAASPVTSVFGRIGAIAAVQADYAAFYAPLNRGLPAGGNPGQVLTKLSATNYDSAWQTPPVGGTVTSVSTLGGPPLFDISVNNPNTTPQLVFATPMVASGLFYGNSQLATGAPNFYQVKFGQLAGIPTTLAGYGITDAQPLDADLTAIAALATTSFGRGGLIQADAPAFRAYIGASGTSGTALTKLDDTNVTLTLIGNPTIALLQSVQLNLGWTGTLAIARGGTGAGNAATALSNLGGEPALGNPGTNGFVLSSTTAGVRSWIAPPSAPVASVFGRTGAVVAASNDYTFAQIGSKPTTLAGYGITDPVVLTSGSYPNPAWITSLAYSKLTGVPAFEPALGNPGTDGFILSSTAAGMRSWITPPAGGSGTVTSVSAGSLAPLFGTTVSNPTTTPSIAFSINVFGANTFYGNNTAGTAAPTAANMAALTATNDTNVTLTLGGTPATALFKAVSLTLGWVGTLAAARMPGLTGDVTSTAGTVNTTINPAITPTWTGLHAWKILDAATGGYTAPITLGHNSSATPAANFGTAVKFQGKSNPTLDRDMGVVFMAWSDPADATRTSYLGFQLVANGSLGNKMWLFASGGLAVNNTTDPGAGIVNANTGFSITGNTGAAGAGQIGEIIASALPSGSFVSYTTVQIKNLTSINLTAGDWDVRGVCTFTLTTVPGSTVFQATANIGTTTGTLADDGEQSYAMFTTAAAAGTGSMSCALPARRISLAGNTTVYLVGKSPAFASGTCGAFGYIEARRIR